MKLFIQIENGKTVNHPALEENLLQAFGKIPDNWELFERIDKPSVKIYQILENEFPIYEKEGQVWKDVWYLRDMTAEEKQQKQQKVKDAWENSPDRWNFDAWTFNEETCSFVSPNGAAYVMGHMWSGAENRWKIVDPVPSNGNSYKFNYKEWKWELK